MLQKRIPSFPGQSVNLWFVFFLKFPWNSPKLQLPPPLQKNIISSFKHLLIPCTPQPLHLPSKNFSTRNMARCTKIWCPKLPQVTSWSPEGSHNIASIASLCSWMKVSSFGCVLNWKKAPNNSSKLFYHCQVIYIYRVSFLGGRSYFIYFCQMLFRRPSFANLKYMNTYTPSNLTQTTTILYHRKKMCLQKTFKTFKKHTFLVGGRWYCFEGLYSLLGFRKDNLGEVQWHFISHHPGGGGVNGTLANMFL